uniref:8.9 kDa family member n=1 Tax=Rhipicephalus appendiculatus TaxID=34631 RepID=A0A131YGP0_RHIAP
MMTMKHLTVYCTLLCVFPIVTCSIKSAPIRNLCPTTPKARCQPRWKLTCLYHAGSLVAVSCEKHVLKCGGAWRRTCRPPLIPSCKTRPTECVCTCVPTKVVRPKGTTQPRG